MVRTKDHANSAFAGAKKTHKGYSYVKKTMHGLAMLCALGSLIASAVAAHKAHNMRGGDDDDDDDDGGHYKFARNLSIAGAVWSGVTLLQQGGSSGSQWKHAKKLQKLRKLKRNNDESQHGLNAPSMGVGAVNLGHGEDRRRRLIDMALQALVVVFGIIVLALWANPLMKRTYRDAAYISSMKAWGILGWIALALLILLLLLALAMFFKKRRNTVDDTAYGNQPYDNQAYNNQTYNNQPQMTTV